MPMPRVRSQTSHGVTNDVAVVLCHHRGVDLGANLVSDHVCASVGQSFGSLLLDRRIEPGVQVDGANFGVGVHFTSTEGESVQRTVDLFEWETDRVTNDI